MKTNAVSAEYQTSSDGRSVAGPTQKATKNRVDTAKIFGYMARGVSALAVAGQRIGPGSNDPGGLKMIERKTGDIISIGRVETGVMQQYHTFDDEQMAESFAVACRSAIPTLYSAQVVNVEYEDPECV